jgi:serine protease inhibitor
MNRSFRRRSLLVGFIGGIFICFIGLSHMVRAATGVDHRLILANARFSIKLFTELYSQDSGKNLLVSPASVAFVLAMTYNGAKGDTQRAMAQTLAVHELSVDELNSANAALKTQLDQASSAIQLSIANALWTKQGLTFNPVFIQRNKDFYGAHVAALDVDAPQAYVVINTWVRQHTVGKITEIVDRLDPSTVMLLVNAIYFKGKWATEFDSARTQEQPFTLLGGQQKSHPLMIQTGRYPYYHGNRFQAVSLPYGSGRVSLYVFLPDEGVSLAALIKTISAEQWAIWMTQFRQTQGYLALPRFQISYEVELNRALSALGMGEAFDPHVANFEAVLSTPSRLYINTVKHKTFIEVNEEGTEAAATTSVDVFATSAMPQHTFTMIVNRPFFCALRDNETGTLLFMGTIVDPQ